MGVSDLRQGMNALNNEQYISIPQHIPRQNIEHNFLQYSSTTLPWP